MRREEKSKDSRCRKPIEGALLEALFQKDRFSHTGRLVRGLIHNINGPLQNLSMLVEMLIKGHDHLDQVAHSQDRNFAEEWESVAGKQKQRLERLTQQIALLAAMLQDFMVLQEIEHNESEVDINLVLNKLAQVFRADLFFKHQVDFELKLTENLPLVRILGRHLVPALMHLFDNALTAMRAAPQKKLIIESQKHPGSIRIVFIDSGLGPDLAGGEEALFDLFYSKWPEAALDERDGKHYGFGLFAVRYLLDPYGVKASLVRDKERTAVVLEIPASC